MGWKAWVVAAMFLMGSVIACGDGSSGGDPTVVPRTPSPTATTGPLPTEQASPFVFVYREFGGGEDILWQLNPTNPDQKAELARIPHSEGFGVWPSLAPDRRSIAYVVFPLGARQPRTESQLWLLDLASERRTQLADRVQLPGLPLWSPDSSTVMVLRNEDGQIQLVEAETTGSPTERLALSVSAEEVLSLFPIGYSADGNAFYFSQITATSAGTEIAALDLATGSVTVVMRASPNIVRELALSPDRRQVAFAAPECGGVCLADLGTKQVRALTATQLASVPFRLIWSADGQRVAAGHADADDRPDGLVVLATGGGGEALAAPARGFDAPLGWSPDGRFLLVHTSEGTPSNPGKATIAAIDLNSGQRREGGGTGSLPDVMAVGWLSAP